MNYEKIYKEALEKAKKELKTCGSMDCDAAKQIFRFFPELKESEDEKIRKELIKLMKQMSNTIVENYTTIEISTFVAWLEKQGEQKSVDKVKPKFHEGDMIIHKELGGDYIHNSHKIIQVDMLDKEYRLEGGLVAHFSEQDDYELVKQKPTWSEEDEKYIDDILAILGGGRGYRSNRQIEDWLKSLKNRVQSQWKPTEEQMEDLKYAINMVDKCCEDSLQSLYNELKKL